jgi:hypothetical protein
MTQLARNFAAREDLYYRTDHFLWGQDGIPMPHVFAVRAESLIP